MTSLLAHGIWLALVLRNTGVYGLDDIRANGGGEDLVIDQSVSQYFQSAGGVPFASM